MRARAKINLSLHVLGRRGDGYHELESLIAFAGVGDELTLSQSEGLSLTIAGPMAGGLLHPSPRFGGGEGPRVGGVAGEGDEGFLPPPLTPPRRKRGEGDVHIAADENNLVPRAARNLAALVPGLNLGAFHLVKRLPVASGIGGGSADAAAALRLLAQANGMARDDARLFEAARATGADVPACLVSRSLIMRGAGEALERVSLPRLFALLVNPGVAVPTAAVFDELGLGRGEMARARPSRPWQGEGEDAAALIQRLVTLRNDLEAPATRIAPIIGEVLAALRDQAGCRLARMSGSGATCFAIFDDCKTSAAAGKRIASVNSGWWVKPTVLG